MKNKITRNFEPLPFPIDMTNENMDNVGRKKTEYEKVFSELTEEEMEDLIEALEASNEQSE